MSYSFHQLIYHNDTSNYNNPIGLTQRTIANEIQQYMPLSQLGIRALPGTKIYINDNPNPLIIGFNGLFEINLSNTENGGIYALTVDEDSLKMIKNLDTAYLILDMVTIGGE